MEKRETLLHYWWEYKLVQPLWRTVWRFLKKLKIDLPYDSAIPLLGIYPEKTIIQKVTPTTMFMPTLFTIARTRKQPKCPSTDEWIKRMWHIYIQWNITQPQKGTKLFHLLRRGWILRLSYRVKSEREKQISYINACMWNLEKWYR